MAELRAYGECTICGRVMRLWRLKTNVLNDKACLRCVMAANILELAEGNNRKKQGLTDLNLHDLRADPGNSSSTQYPLHQQ
jgi:hypothetical protein